MKSSKEFNPLMFLAALGAGGISVMPFSFFQYTHHTGKGLITWAQMGHGNLPVAKEVLFYSLEGVMALFAIIHLAFTAALISKLAKFIRSEGYETLISNPLANAAILAPFISVGMTFNVFIGSVRFFVPAIAENLQALMLPALLAWGALWLGLLAMEIKLLGISFAKSFDVSKIHFGWLLHPFALGMITVTGTGIAALAKDPSIAHTAAFMSAVSGSMGLFLLTVKLSAIFKSHFSASGLPDKTFLPSMLAVVPNLTLYAISGFRLAHYAEHQFGADAHAVGTVIVIAAFAFQTWYMMFGLSMLRGYFKKHVFGKEFHLSQWGLICPFVAYAVLGAFFAKSFVTTPLVLGVILVTMVAAVSLYGLLLYKQGTCAARQRADAGHDCSAAVPARA